MVLTIFGHIPLQLLAGVYPADAYFFTIKPDLILFFYYLSPRTPRSMVFVAIF